MMRDILDELESLEPCVRQLEAPALVRVRFLLNDLQFIWDKNQFDPDLEVDIANMRTRMQLLVFAVEANIFKDVIKGPREFANDQRVRDIKANIVKKCGQERRRNLKRKATSHPLAQSAAVVTIAIATPKAQDLDEVVECHDNSNQTKNVQIDRKIG